MSGTIFYDLNARDPFVSDSTDVMLIDTKTVVQSVWRLLTTEEGEIPNFRGYGLSIRRFVQYPMSKETVEMIYEYVKSKVSTYEDRADIISAEVDASFEKEEIHMAFILRVRDTQETVKLPILTFSVGGAS